MAVVRTNQFRVKDSEEAWEILAGLDMAVKVTEHDNGTFSIRGSGVDGELNNFDSSDGECIFGDLQKVLPDGEAVVVQLVDSGFVHDVMDVTVSVITNEEVKEYSLNELTKLATKDMNLASDLTV